GYDLSGCAKYAQDNQVILEKLSDYSRRYHMAIGGSYITRHKDHFFNTFLVTLPDGTISSPYFKIHLFRPLNEPLYFEPGSTPVVLDLNWAIVGLALCYDLRFPDLFQFYARAGVNCILIAAQWGALRREHWRILLRARAIENQAFVIAANAVGSIDHIPLAGCSTIVSPWGETILEGSPTESGLLETTLDFSEITVAKNHLDTKLDQRDSLYKQWFDQSRD
ncbi:MAG: nitrilase-related carbon-nitrogen hydrolase, partial [Chloroflexota bacterium]